jgi:hypothetical protein
VPFALTTASIHHQIPLVAPGAKLNRPNGISIEKPITGHFLSSSVSRFARAALAPMSNAWSTSIGP